MARTESTPFNAHNILTSRTVISGKICAEEDFRIDGIIEGEVICNGKVVVGRSSVVTGNLQCTNLELLGEMTGNITCTNTVILREASKMNGDIATKSIEIEPGASFSGACFMIAEENSNVI